MGGNRDILLESVFIPERSRDNVERNTPQRSVSSEKQPQVIYPQEVAN